MQMQSAKKVITLVVGILIAFLIANVLTNVVVILSGLKGAAGMVVSFVVYAVVFFFVLHLLEKYAHFVFFGFDRE
jgi:O-antigen/teichoic acid export membrane protein